MWRWFREVNLEKKNTFYKYTSLVGAWKSPMLSGKLCGNLKPKLIEDVDIFPNFKR